LLNCYDNLLIYGNFTNNFNTHINCRNYNDVFCYAEKLSQLGGDKTNDQSMLMLQNQLNNMTQTLDVKLAEVHKANQDQAGKTTGVMSCGY